MRWGSARRPAALGQSPGASCTVEVGELGGLEERTGEGEVSSEGVAVVAEIGSGVSSRPVGEGSTTASEVAAEVCAWVVTPLV